MFRASHPIVYRTIGVGHGQQGCPEHCQRRHPIPAVGAVEPVAGMEVSFVVGIRMDEMIGEGDDEKTPVAEM